MSDIAIRVDRLGKQYRLGRRENYSTLRDTLVAAAKTPWRWLSAAANGNGRREPETIWAVRDLSFEVTRGEVVGIVGRNGAGKSTLLKILSQITEPTTGQVELSGRVASLLEVGTGFHPELTGRENVFLNGAILGMKRAEIVRKFDEIVAFAEVEQFLDTPVKHYSSGMYMRLAFAVAAHLEPEILVVDEVLAVGDAEFQKKCLGKMSDVARGGRTVLFVSHNLHAVQKLCSRSLLLARGEVRFCGDTDSCLKEYLRSTSGSSSRVEIPNQSGSGDLRFLEMAITDRDAKPLPLIRVMQPFRVAITFEAAKRFDRLIIGFGVHNLTDLPLLATHTNDYGELCEVTPGTWTVVAHFQPNYLREGEFILSLGAIAGNTLLAHIPRACSITIEPIVDDLDRFYDQRIGALFVPMQWDKPQLVAPPGECRLSMTGVGS